MLDPINDDAKGAINQILFLSLSKIFTSINCATRNAVPDPIEEDDRQEFPNSQKIYGAPQRMAPEATPRLSTKGHHQAFTYAETNPQEQVRQEGVEGAGQEIHGEVEGEAEEGE